MILATMAYCAPAQSTRNAFLPDGVSELGWPTMRGPHLNGHSDEIHLADAWPPSGPPVLWTRRLGQSYSSVTTAHDRVFTQYQTLAGQYVLCMDAASGDTIWEHRYGWAYEATGLYPGPRSTPTVADHRVYFTSPDAVVGCLSWDGVLLWSVDLAERFGSRGTEFGYACSPVIEQGHVLLPLGGKNASMVALDAATGRVAWHSGDEPASYASALPIRVGQQTQVVGYMQHALCGFDLLTGNELWKVSLSRGYDEHSSWPLYREPHLWISAPFQAGWQLFKVLPSEGDRAASIQRVMQGDNMSNDVASSVLVDGYVYGFDLAEAQSKAHRPSRGQFRCIDFMTGETQWENGSLKVRRSTDFDENAKTQTVGHASVVVADDKLILLSDLGELILAKANPSRYEELGRVSVLGGEIGWAAPALHRGCLYVRNQERLVCLHLGEEAFISPTVRENAIPLSELSGRYWDWSVVLGVEPEYAMDPPTSRWLVNWFIAISGCFLAAALATVGVAVVKRRRISGKWYRGVFAGWAFAACLVSGGVISLVTNDFVFTWPGCLFVALTVAIYLSKSSRRLAKTEQSKSRSRGDLYGVLIFLATCWGYFLVCRRLSLVTQWVFLFGSVTGNPPVNMPW
ncbi:outer membrane biogenesis protein BamB [Stieleria varia]|uniref:Outer membrane biogenesis protein BamB n=2 Tax=Stieleria varia TaxID=2528005 RepID=A0A5C6AHE6_9BACT|nr:outer membrane biogenesis protein BamB [Stieleria varia]